MTERQKHLLIQFFARERHIDDPDLDLILRLDDLAESIYSKHRIKKGFGEAHKISIRKVIDEILKIK